MNYLTSIIIIIIISHYNVIASNPLLTAILRNDRTTAHGIIANPKTNVNEKINDGKFGVTQPLQYAIQWGRTDIIKYLLDRKDLAINEPFDVGSFQGNITPLQLAFSPTQKEVIKTLLTSPNIDLNVQIDGKPLLSHILQMQLKDYQSIIKAILAHKNFRVSMLYQKDSEGRTPIDWAKRTKDDEVIKLFKDKEASMNKDDTSKNTASNPNVYRYLSSSSNKLSSPSKVELDSTYYKKRREFLNKPETNQKDLKQALVDKEKKIVSIHRDIKLESLNIDEKCVFIWTTNAYTRIKEALKEDDNNELNYWIPCIAGVVNYLKRTENKQIITYRGAKITMEQSKLYKLYSQEKTLVTVPTMLSTSISEQTALLFPAGGVNKPNVAVLFVVSVPENIEAAYIEKLSNFQAEKEMLLKPYTVFKVKKYSTEGKPRPYIYVEIVDCRKNNCIKAVKSVMG